MSSAPRTDVPSERTISSPIYCSFPDVPWFSAKYPFPY
ncbi:hypothetical protein EVA_07270 [gut metagenome]|uniref:Uncharacterized protein n=1 Tax=gut metagenome TaxID=749906 RepID=J9CWK7_9ZZZZ